ncbi:hypothetical protein [Actinoplanes sp. M2I2]|uniref:hypothetical protein n=1 Tax=Actinoplanes sp. M2I2 TaxID=1734444 RepID=UPI00202126B7|nr:hypothetical protein [Actinoplanes sp. M2I2]
MMVHRQIVVRIDTDVDAAARARQVTEGLLELRVIVDRPGPELPYGPGPAAADHLEPGEQWVDHEDNGVDIVAERSAYHAFTNWARPNCDRCGSQPDRETMQSAFEAWLGGPEPTVACRECDWTARAGDWPAPWPFAVGAPAVLFQNWPALDPQLLNDVRAAIGGRTRIIRVVI